MFKLNRNLARDLEGEPEHRSGLAKATEPAARAAKAIAPVGTVTHTLKGGWVNEAGDYQRSIKVIERGNEVYLSAFDYKAHWIEFGSVNNPVSAPLRRGAQAAGLRFKEGR
jgi:hypothetical protein